MESDDPTTDESAGLSAGGASLAGYEYQIDVSVWVALDLLLASKLAHQVVLEPASQEDLEGELDDTEPGHLTSIAPVKSYTLVVQAKLRTGDAWTAKSIIALLNHGGEKRKSALERLKDPSLRYLLVTSAGLNGKTKGLGIRRPGVWPKLYEKSIVATLVTSMRLLGESALNLLRLSCELHGRTPVSLRLAKGVFHRAFALEPAAAEEYFARAVNQSEMHSLATVSVAEVAFCDATDLI